MLKRGSLLLASLSAAGLALAVLLGLRTLEKGEGVRVWRAPALEAKVLEAGYSRASASGAWEPQLGLRFRNLDPKKRYHKELHVDFIGAEGRTVATVRTFVSLAGGAAQHRRYRAPGKLACKGSLEACPELAVRIRELEGDASPLPHEPVEAEKSPPEGVPVYAALVLDGDTLVLVGGERIRLLGVDTPEREPRTGGRGPEPFYREALEHTRERAMAGPLKLRFDGEKQDVYGRWLALVSLEDGTLLNLELLKLGLARVYPRSSFALKPDFEAAEAAARAEGLGLWGRSLR